MGFYELTSPEMEHIPGYSEFFKCPTDCIGICSRSHPLVEGTLWLIGLYSSGAQGDSQQNEFAGRFFEVFLNSSEEEKAYLLESPMIQRSVVNLHSALKSLK